MQLSMDQQTALEQMLAWYQSGTNDPFLLTGAAGCGKTTLIKTLLDRLALNRENVLVTATSALAMSNAQEKLSDGSDQPVAKTIASCLKQPFAMVQVNAVGVNSDGTVEPGAIGAEGFTTFFDEVMRLAKKANLSSLDPVQNLLVMADSDLERVNYGKLNQLLGQQAGDPPIFKYFVDFRDRLTVTDLVDVHLMVVDEISMVSQHDLEGLLMTMNKHGMPTLLLGDPYQLEPVNEPLNHYILGEENVPSFELKTVHRQGPTSHVLAVADTVRQTGVSLKQAVVDELNNSNQQGKKVNDLMYGEISPQLPVNALPDLLLQADQTLTFTNRTVERLTKLIRDRKFGTNVHANKPRLGDRLLITQNEPGFWTQKKINDERLVNGSSAIVAHKYTNKEVKHLLKTFDASYYKLYLELKLMLVDLELEDTHQIVRKVMLNTTLMSNPKISPTAFHNSKDYANFPKKFALFNKHVLMQPDWQSEHHQILYATFGYVKTVHKAQGLEWPNVVYYQDSMARNMGTARLEYTALTRAQTKFTLIVA